MAATASADYLRDPQGITRRSFAIIRRETDVGGLPPGLVDVAYRMVHASGMTDLVADLAWSDDVAEAARGALAAGAPILADCRMVASGISRPRLAAGNEVICTLGAPGVAARAAAARTTRSAAAVELWQTHLEGALCVIATRRPRSSACWSFWQTALRRLRRSSPRPPASSAPARPRRRSRTRTTACPSSPCTGGGGGVPWRRRR